MGKIWLWIIRLVLGTVTLMASVGPDDVSSNFGSWLKLFGAENLPSLLTRQSIDQPIALMAVLLMIVTILPWKRIGQPIKLSFAPAHSGELTQAPPPVVFQTISVPTEVASPQDDPTSAKDTNMALIAAKIRSRERDIELLKEQEGRIRGSAAQYGVDWARWTNDQFFHSKQGHAMRPAPFYDPSFYPSLTNYELPAAPTLLAAEPKFEVTTENGSGHKYLASDNHEFIAARMENMGKLDRWATSVRSLIGTADGEVSRLQEQLAALDRDNG